MPDMPDNRTFTYEQALATFPRVKETTHAAVKQVEALMNRVRSQEDLAERREEIQKTHNQIVRTWAEEISLAGCEVKGLWLVDWDSGAGYYCWKYPEETLSFFHTYDDGFSGRVPIA